MCDHVIKIWVLGSLPTLMTIEAFQLPPTPTSLLSVVPALHAPCSLHSDILSWTLQPSFSCCWPSTPGLAFCWTHEAFILWSRKVVSLQVLEGFMWPTAALQRARPDMGGKRWWWGSGCKIAQYSKAFGAGAFYYAPWLGQIGYGFAAVQVSAPELRYAKDPEPQSDKQPQTHAILKVFATLQDSVHGSQKNGVLWGGGEYADPKRRMTWKRL